MIDIFQTKYVNNFIDRGISEIYNGNYSFVEQKSLNEESQNKAYQLQKEIEIQKKYIDRFRASATRSSQAKSRKKQLKDFKIEAPRAQSKSPTLISQSVLAQENQF